MPTIVFDLDGTLVDSVPDLAAALNRLARARGLEPFGRPEVAAMVGDGARALAMRAFAARGSALDEEAYASFISDYNAHVAVESRVYPGAIDALRRFADDGWTMAVCTNKPAEPARALLAALGLATFFSAVGGGDSFSTLKPDPRHLVSTLEAAGGAPDMAIMVGDHGNDVRAAAGAGVPCIFAAWGYGLPAMAEGAAAVARDFSDIPELAKALLQPPPIVNASGSA